MVVKLITRREFALPEPFAVVHVILTLIMLALGNLFLDPRPTMVTEPWLNFLHYMDETAWGKACFYAAGLGVIGIATNRKWIAAASSCCLGSAHMTIAFIMFRTHDPASVVTLPPGVYVYGLIAVLGYIVTLWRIGEWLGFIRSRTFVLDFSRLIPT